MDEAMAGGINKLSAIAVQKAKEPGYYGDGGGLWLQISKLGGKSWVFRFTLHGKPREMGLGPVHTVTLAEARVKALENRKLVAEGSDPIIERQTRMVQAKLEAAKTKTFKECALGLINDKRSEWKNEKHAAQWLSTLETYAFPLIGSLSAASIDNEHVLRVLRQDVPIKDGGTAPLWLAKNETASRLRGRIETVLDWAKVSAKCREGENPARWKGNLEHSLPKPSKIQKVKHHAALPYREIGFFLAELRQREGIAARALEFAILTVARSSEIRGATWQEIDLGTKTWIIPSGRMKAGKEHQVPLPDSAIALLKTLPRIVGNNYVFPAPRGGQLSDMSLTAVLKRMGRSELTQHGFRSTFREWAGEQTHHAREVIEHALAHQLKDKAEAAYQRGTLWPKRIALMDDWGNYCNREEHNAIPLHKSMV